MKKKLIIIVLMFAIVGLFSNAFADKSTPFTSITLDTNNDGFVDAIDVYVTFNIIDGSTTWLNLTDDFEVGGYTSAVTVDGVDTGDIDDDNIFRVHIYSGVPNTIPTDIQSLLIRYFYDGTNQIVTTDGYLWPFNWMNVEDGAAPSLVSTTFISDHANGSLAVVGTTITVNFESNEELLDFPTVKIYAVGGPTGDPINATMVGDRYHWSANRVMTGDDDVSGFIEAIFTIEDLNYNEDTKTVTSTITYKAETATEVWVDPTYTAQVNVPSGKYWLWDCFEKIQEGIDGVANPGTVNVNDGTYDEQLIITKSNLNLIGESNTATIIQPSAAPAVDVSDVAIGLFGGSNVNNVTIQYILFDFNGAGDSRHGQGIVVSDLNGPAVENVVIEQCVIYCGLELATPEPKCGIQTGKNADLDGLIIRYNDFYGTDGTYGSYGVYINPNSGEERIIVLDNDFYGKFYAGVSIESNKVDVTYNTINPASGGTYGIRVIDFVGGVTYNDIEINYNDIDNLTYGINVGMSSSHGSTLAPDIEHNTINTCDVGIRVREDAVLDGSVHYNDLSNNISFGIKVESTSNVDAENNWWGSASGPIHSGNTYTAPDDKGTEHRSEVSNNVDYVPWYDFNMNGSWFAPVHSDDGSAKAITYFSSIQTALDAAASGATLTCQAGTFDEQISIEVSNLTLVGVSNTATIIQPSAAPAVDVSDVAIGLFGGSNVDHVTIKDILFDFNGADGLRHGQGIVVSDLNGPAVEDVVIEYCNIYCGLELATPEPKCGIQSGKNAVLDGLIIRYNDFYGTDGLYGSYGVYINPNSGIGRITVTNNNFYGKQYAGVSIESNKVDVTNNTINPASGGTYGIRVVDFVGGVNYDDIIIGYNDIDNVTYGINVGMSTSSGSILAPDIEHNTINYCDVGIRVREDAVLDGSVHYNDLSNNTSFGIKVESTSNVDATDNWWGSANGPNHVDNTFNVGSQGVVVTDLVDYVPWYNESMSGASFWPVEILSKGDPYFSSIQTAIDAASYGDEIYCYAGTFTEDFVVDVGVLIEGEPETKQLVTIVGEQEITADDVTIDNFTFELDGSGYVIIINSTASTIDNITIQNCVFEITTSPSVGIHVGGYNSPMEVSNVSIQNNTFNGPVNKVANPWKIGHEFGNNVGCKVDGLTFYNNEVNEASIPINLVDENISNISVTYNDFFDTDGVIYFWNDSGNSPIGVLSNFVFENNYVPSTNSYGIAIGGASLGGPIFTDANFGLGNAINNNSFEISGTTYGYGAVYMADNYTGLLDAENNWWGDAYGPINDNSTYTPPAKGQATVSDRVKFAPWWNDGTDAEPGRGWEHDPSVAQLFAPVTNVTQTTYHSSIQRAIDAAGSGNVLTCIAGTFTEDLSIPATKTDLEIRPNGTAKAYDDVTIKGVSTLAWINWPLADPNIDILASVTKIHHFTIESPDVADGYYSSGMVIDGTNVEIYNNDFVMVGIGDVGVGIQTYRDNVLGYYSDITGLNIHNNTFSGTPTGGEYVATFINHQSFAKKTNPYIYIVDNDYSGYVYQGIVTERDYTVISGNTITRSYPIKQKTGYGIIIQDWDARPQDNVEVDDNSISNFAYGILIGRTTPSLQTLTNIYIHDNDINQNNVGVKVRASLSGVTINYNNISGNDTYGVENATYGKVEILNATKNWWGDATGATHSSNPHADKGYGDGDDVNDGVDFIPWYATSTVTPSTEYVRTHGSTKIPPQPDLAFADVIQACIDAAADVYYFVQVTDAATPYTENLTVDNQAYLYGEGLLKATVTITGSHYITTSNVTVDNLILTNTNYYTLNIDASAGPIDNIDITNCTFNLIGYAGVHIGGDDGSTNLISNVEMSDNTFNGPTSKASNPFKIGGYFGHPGGCNVDGVLFQNNWVDKASIPVNLHDQNINDIQVRYNTFTNTDGVIYFWDDPGVKSSGVLSYFEFCNNYVDGTNSYGIGIDVKSVFDDSNFGDGNAIYDNYFQGIPGLDLGGLNPGKRFEAVSILSNLSTYVLDAEENWWGSRSGPIHSGNTYTTPPVKNGGRCTVSDNVDYVRWYDDGTDLYPGDVGFDPAGNLFAPVEIVLDEKGYPYFSSIQAAIDEASSDDEIVCYAGTFTEDFSVPNTVTGLELRPAGTAKVYDVVTIKGIATDLWSIWPFATPNIEILADNTKIHDFTIENPDVDADSYSSGIVFDGVGVQIYNNNFVLGGTGGAGAVGIQSYRDNVLGYNSDISNTSITGNSFTSTLEGGCVGIWINHTLEGVGTVTISDNNLTANMYQGIVTERSYTTISGNTIDNGLDNSGRGIQVYDLDQRAQSDVLVDNNTITDFEYGVRVGYGTAALTGIVLTNNTITSNAYGVQVRSSAGGVTINGNSITNNVTYGVQNTDTGAKVILDATNNWWGDATGPSFTFDYGLGTGSGDEVSTYVDYTPWYDTSIAGNSYYPTVTQFVMELNPTSPYQNNYFDIRIAAADANGTRNQDYGNLADFSSSHAALTVPEEQLLVDGFKEVTNGCISTEAFAATDHLTIYTWEYNTNPPSYYSSLTDIVIQPESAPAPPTAVSVSDVPDDNGGWIYLDYTMSVDDPFYSPPPKAAGVSYYIVERDADLGVGTNWQYFATIGCYNYGSNNVRALLNAPASDDEYDYRMASVHNPSKDYNFGDDHISYEPILMGKDGSQSAWVFAGSAAAADNLPAYADFTIFLEGPYAGSRIMNTGLTSLLPGAPANAVDWVQVQLRTTPDGATVKQADAYLLNDGSIVDVDGNYSLPFYYTTGINYYIVIRHRNHLDIMTSTAKAFGDFESEATTIVLYTPGSVWDNGFKEVETGVYAMYAGDADENGQVNPVDRNDYWRLQTGTGGYKSADFDLNGEVNPVDRNDYWRNNTGIGTKVPPQNPEGGSGNNGENIVLKDAVGITFTFDNGEITAGGTYGYYEFDVMANASATGTKIGTGIVYINYNTSGFGENIYGSGNVTVTKGTLTNTPFYLLLLNDHLSSRLAVTFEYGVGPGYGSDLPTTPTDLIHVKIVIADPAESSDLSFQESLMIDNQYYDDNTTKYDPVTATDALNVTLPVVLSTFTAQYLNNVPTLYWVTQSETENIGWYVYRGIEDDFTTTERVTDLIEGHGTTSEPHDYFYYDEELEAIPGDMYWYWIESVEYGGQLHSYGPVVITIPPDDDPEPVVEKPKEYGLHQNKPNPFVMGSGSTKISFAFPNTVKAELKIYNILGELVRNLYSGPAYGDKLIEVDWDGRNDSGVVQAPGIYLYQLKVDGKSYQIKRLILMR